jgi:sulfate transport system ATP-binding protein
VLHFLGNVNIFHGRVQDGKALLGPLAVEFPEHQDTEPRTAAGYARPHELDVSRSDEQGGGLWASVQDIRTSGAVAKLELSEGEGSLIQVDLGREQFERLRPIVGERLYITPRRLRVFMSDAETPAIPNRSSPARTSR